MIAEDIRQDRDRQEKAKESLEQMQKALELQAQESLDQMKKALEL